MIHASKTLPAVVYLITNTVNGKRYIGVTTRSVHIRMAEHITRALRGVSPAMFDRAIRKYGPDAFELSVLVECGTGAEALVEEMRLVAELKPEYNSTAGGDGNVGRKMSDEGKKRIAEKNRGNSYHKGHQHSSAAKAKMSAAASQMDRLDAWSKFAKLGPASLAKRVICIDDGVIHLSAAAAARAYQVDCGALTQVCNGRRYRKSIGGRRFAYVEEA